MQTLEFYIVDVFAESQYAGNQLAVFRNSEGLTKEEMQRIARETNFAETTFIASDERRQSGFDVRIFTPQAEVPFAGHPTLGTAFIIKEKILDAESEQIKLNLAVGPIPVDFVFNNGTLDTIWMTQINPTFGRILSAGEVAPVLNIDATEIDSRYPIREVSTGLPYIIVPLRTLQSVKKCRVDLAIYTEFLRSLNPDLSGADSENVPLSAFHVFCPETYESNNHLNARMFDTYYGVPEDPATGSANGCLLAYLLKYNYFGREELDLRVEQGCEINRPSLLHIRGKRISADEMAIRVGGKVHLVAKGEWYHERKRKKDYCR